MNNFSNEGKDLLSENLEQITKEIEMLEKELKEQSNYSLDEMQSVQQNNSEQISNMDSYQQSNNATALALYNPLPQQQNTLVPYVEQTNPFVEMDEEEIVNSIKRKRTITAIAYSASVAVLAIIVFVFLLLGMRS